MKFHTNLAAIARNTGFPVTEVSGWETRGLSGATGDQRVWSTTRARLSAIEAAIAADPNNPVTQEQLNKAVAAGLAGAQITLQPGSRGGRNR